MRNFRPPLILVKGVFTILASYCPRYTNFDAPFFSKFDFTDHHKKPFNLSLYLGSLPFLSVKSDNPKCIFFPKIMVSVSDIHRCVFIHP